MDQSSVGGVSSVGPDSPARLVPPTLQSVLASVASVASVQMRPKAYSSDATDAADAGSGDGQGGEE